MAADLPIALPPHLLEALEAHTDPSGTESASDRARSLLRGGILRGVLAPGTPLTEGEIATVLGISRTPVRAALHSLQQEGLVEIGARRQLVVRRADLAGHREVMRVREALERISVAQAAETMELTGVDELRLLIIRQRRVTSGEDVESFIDLDDEFHRSIAVGASMELIERFLGELGARIRMMGLRAVTEHGRMIEVLAEHEAIVDAIEARDRDAAVLAMETHLARTFELLEGLGVLRESG